VAGAHLQSADQLARLTRLPRRLLLLLLPRGLWLLLLRRGVPVLAGKRPGGRFAQRELAVVLGRRGEHGAERRGKRGAAHHARALELAVALGFEALLRRLEQQVHLVGRGVQHPRVVRQRHHAPRHAHPHIERAVRRGFAERLDELCPVRRDRQLARALDQPAEPVHGGHARAGVAVAQVPDERLDVVREVAGELLAERQAHAAHHIQAAHRARQHGLGLGLERALQLLDDGEERAPLALAAGDPEAAAHRAAHGRAGPAEHDRHERLLHRFEDLIDGLLLRPRQHLLDRLQQLELRHRVPLRDLRERDDRRVQVHRRCPR